MPHARRRTSPARWGLLLACLALAACAGREPVHGTGAARPAAVVDTALEQVGRPYRYGGCDPAAGFDCSGLVQYAYAVNGVSLPRETEALLTVGRPVGYADLAPADLVFFQVSKKPKDLHVGLYVGGDAVLMVHSPKSGATVRTESLAKPYWRDRFIEGRRVLPQAGGKGNRNSRR